MASSRQVRKHAMYNLTDSLSSGLSIIHFEMVKMRHTLIIDRNSPHKLRQTMHKVK